VLGRRPTWDDLVSGRGLELIHGLVHRSDSCETSESPLSAVQIGEGAAAGITHCVGAVRAFYELTGSFAQGLALTLMASGGVFLGGSTTTANIDTIQTSDFADRISRSHAMGPLLSSVGVFAVTTELNLRGAWAQAQALL
jgi:glucokinase